MSEYARKQRRFMNEAWVPPHWEERAALTPTADLLTFSTLHACRTHLPADLRTKSFLIVNCGNGVDTYFFQTEGVVSPAISDQAERPLRFARGHCIDARPVVSTTEALPFADQSFDWVGVRAGLHHLETPLDGLHEMARVAREGIFLIEVHQTPLVPFLARLGLLEIEEEAGNVVYRFSRQEIESTMHALGAGQVIIQTGWFMQIPRLIRISKAIPGRLPAVAMRAWVWFFNVLFGRWGNAIIAVAYK